jgi:hypothetical protein
MRRFITCVFGGMIFLMFVGQLLGGNGEFKLQTHTGAMGTLQLAVDTRWVDGHGLRPVRLRLSDPSGATSPQDQRFRVELLVEEFTQMWGPKAVRRVVVQREIVLAQGANAVEATVLVPQFFPWKSLTVRVWEGHRQLVGLESRHDFGAAPNNRFQEMDLTSILFVDDDVRHYTTARISGVGSVSTQNQHRLFNAEGLLQVIPSLRMPATAAETSSEAAGSVESEKQTDWVVPHPGDYQVVGRLSNYDKVAMITPEDLPDVWIGLSAVDVIITSSKEIQLLASQYPEKLQAVRRWLLAGHTLIVADLDGRDQLRALEQTLGISPQYRSEEADSWRSPQGRVYSYPQVFAQLDDQWRLRWPAPPGQRTPGRSQVSVSGVEPKFQWRPVGQGALVGMQLPDPCSDRLQLSWVFDTVPLRCLLDVSRYGSVVDYVPPQSEISIPGIGEPPVVMFVITITLFAIVVGPLNYWVLWRRKRTHWLLITVPACAALVSLAIIAYALLSDGLGVRARIRSLTWVDSDTGSAIVLASQSYYAGIAPSTGLRFSDQVLVLPYRGSIMGENISTREVAWTNGQSWRGAYFRSRTLSPFFITSIEDRPIGVVFHTGESPEMRNDLGAFARSIYLRDDTGRWWYVGDVGQGEKGTPVPIEMSAMTAQLRRSTQESAVGPRPIARRMSYAIPQVDVLGSFPRTDIRFLYARIVNLEDLPDRPFIAVVDLPAWMPVGVGAPQEKGSQHIIVGSWSSGERANGDKNVSTERKE